MPPQQLSCHYSTKNRGASMSGIVTIGSGNEGDLQSAVAYVGPVSTYVDASHSSFQVCYYTCQCVCAVSCARSSRCFFSICQFYSDGIMDIPNCSRSKLTHAMVIIGYGSGRNKDYWLLKNR